MHINWASSNVTILLQLRFLFSKTLCVSEVKILTYDMNNTFASFAFILTNGEIKELSLYT